MKRRLLLIQVLIGCGYAVSAQPQDVSTQPPAASAKPLAPSPDSLIHQLRSINSAVAAAPRALISQRAMNIFLSNKVGYYLSESDNLTLYKNAVLVNAATGSIAIDHSLYQAKGLDSRIRAFTTIGVKANAADAFAATYARRLFNNRFGFIVKQTWMAKTQSSVSSIPQKHRMDARRAGILHTLEGEIKQKTAVFEDALKSFDTLDVPGQDITIARDDARQQFNTEVRDEYYYTFARLQSEALAKSFDYKQIRLHWTSVSIYIPLITENFEVAPPPTVPPNPTDSLPPPATNIFAKRHGYPLHINLSHTRLWDNTSSGRFYATIAGDLILNNSRDGYELEPLSSPKWAYAGAYDNFLTPAGSAQFIYFPPTSHVGFSAFLEQNFGRYHALNASLGVPIVLINKKEEPACNFEFQVRFFDLTNTVHAGRGLPGKTSIGLTVGVPFSKIAF